MRNTTMIDTAVDLLNQLPGLGTRSSRRLLLQLLKKKDTLLKPLTLALDELYAHVNPCAVCFTLDTQSPCSICADSTRDHTILCVVEDVASLWAMERGHRYKGLYHVLNGTLSAMAGVGPAHLHVPELEKRLRATPQIQEVMFALSATVEGQTTAHYIAKQLESLPLTITALGHGIPIGGELDYLDDGTLTAAIASRKSLT